MIRSEITGLLLTILAVSVATETPVLTDNKYNTELLDQDYLGTYNAISSNSLFDYFDVTSGSMEMIFLNNPTNISDGHLVNELVIDLFNPKYHDGKAAAIVIQMGVLNDSSTTWQAVNDTVEVYLFQKQQSFSQSNCTCDYTISLESNGGNNDPESITVKLWMQSFGDGICNFSFEGELHYNDFKLTAILYCLFVSAVTLGQILSAYRVIKAYTNGTIEASKLSLATVAFCNIQDLFLTCMHLYFLMAQDQYYIYFILPIFLLVLLSVVFDMKLLFIVWRTKYVSGNITTTDLRKRLTVFYIKFYLGLFTYLTIMYFFPYDIWSILIQALLFMPQIVHNVRKGNNPHFYPFYVLGVLGMRMILPLYYRGCPSNIYVIEPSVAFCAIWSSLFLMQVIILFLQHKLGPRFFIPRCMIPGYYNYSFKYKVSDQEEIKDCTICLQPLHHPMSDEPNSINSPLIEHEAMVMRAPCEHMFHKECLSSWIDVKLECPTCRAVLPPLNS